MMLFAFLVIGVAGSATAAASTQNVPATPTTVCSLRVNDWTSDCMRMTSGVTHGELIPGVVSFDWIFTGTGPDSYTIHWRSDDDQCLDTMGAWVDAPVVLRPCDGRPSQTWVMEMNRPAGPYRLFHPLRNGFSGLYLTFERVSDGQFTYPTTQRPFGDRHTQYFGLLGSAV